MVPNSFSRVIEIEVIIAETNMRIMVITPGTNIKTLYRMNSQPVYTLIVSLVFAVIPLQANALLLDCEINADKTYTCIEISGAVTADTPEDQKSFGEEYSSYFEQAKQSCVYEEPQKRTVGKGSGSAQRSEKIKTARMKYDDCVRDKARILWRQNNSPNQLSQ